MKAKARTVKCWVVVDGSGHPFLSTTGLSQYESMYSFEFRTELSFKHARQKHGYRVVPAVLTVDPPKPRTRKRKGKHA